MSQENTPSDPHRSVSIRQSGTALEEAAAALILIHGRGATAESILALSRELALDDVAYLAPQAANRTWYPYSFMAPIAQNEPHLPSALKLVDRLVTQVSETVPLERVGLLGFSQGACLATEYAARHPQRYAGVFGLSGGLIGPEGTTFEYDGAMAETPVFLGCSDRDPHIPRSRVAETAAAFRDLGAAVEERIYEGMGHTVNRDELQFVRATLAAVVEK